MQILSLNSFHSRHERPQGTGGGGHFTTSRGQPLLTSWQITGKPHHSAVQTGKHLHDSSLCCVLVLVFPDVCAKFFAVSGEAARPGRRAEDELIPAQLQLFRRFVSPPCLHQAEPSTARGRNCWVWVPQCDTST